MAQGGRTEMRRGLSDIVVLETSGSLAVAFACALLADFGARVFVCEPPPTGSAIRQLGGQAVRKVWWKIIARNKCSAALDVLRSGAEAVAKAVVRSVDIVFVDSGETPDLARKWVAAAAGADQPPLIVDVFPTGTDRPDLWPWGTHPALAAAATGMMALTGWEGERPIQPEFPLTHYLAGVLAASHALMQLRRSDLADERPPPIGMAVHEAVQRMIEWQIPIASALGRPELRNSNKFPMAAGISNIHRSRDGRYVITSAATQSVALRLLAMVGGVTLRDNPRYATVALRQKYMHEIDEIIDRWMAVHTLAEILEAGHRYDVVLGPVYDTPDILQDEHMAARQNVTTLADDAGVKVPMPNIVPTIVGRKASVTHLGPDIGAQSDRLLQHAGFTPEAIAELRASEVIWA